MSENVRPLLEKLHSKMDTVDHNLLAAITRLEALDVRLTAIDGKTDSIIEHVSQGGLVPVETVAPDEKAIKEVLYNPTSKHMEVGEQYLGMHEVQDNKILSSFLGIDPHKVYWCAYYAKSCYDNAGMKSLGGVAHDYTTILKKIDKPVFGCACIWKNHIAFFYGYADGKKLSGLKKYGKVNSLEDWEKVKCAEDNPDAVIMVMGGNQSDMCNISPKDFYDNYTDFDGYYENVG